MRDSFFGVERSIFWVRDLNFHIHNKNVRSIIKSMSKLIVQEGVVVEEECAIGH